MTEIEQAIMECYDARARLYKALTENMSVWMKSMREYQDRIILDAIKGKADG